MPTVVSVTLTPAVCPALVIERSMVWSGIPSNSTSMGAVMRAWSPAETGRDFAMPPILKR